MPANPPPINFDAETRAAVYVELVVTQDNVDPATGINLGTVDASTPLLFQVNQGAGPPAAVTVSQIAVLPDGTRVVRCAPGVLPIGAGTQPWSVRVTAQGFPVGAGSVTLSGSTPAPVSLQGVGWNGVPESTTQPS